MEVAIFLDGFSLVPGFRYIPNIAPENGWLEDVFPTEIAPVQGTCYF